MSKIDKIKAMLASGHPVTLSPYTGTAVEVAAEMNLANIDTDSDVMSGVDFRALIRKPEFDALDTDAKRATVLEIMGWTEIDSNGIGATIVKTTFGSGTNTFSAINAASQKQISHATQQKISRVRVGQVEEARL